MRRFETSLFGCLLKQYFILYMSDAPWSIFVILSLIRHHQSESNMAAETDNSAGFTADQIAFIFTVLDDGLNSTIFQGQLLGANAYNLLNFWSNLRDICRHIYRNYGLHIVEHL